MRDNTPPDTIGYVVVSLPDRGVWQGFFVTRAFEKTGRALLENARREVAEAGSRGPALERPGNVDLDLLDQPMVGLLSAALAQLLDRATADGSPQGAMAASMMDVVGAAAWGLVEVTGRPWLLVHGRRDPIRPGFSTRVEVVEADGVDEAREKIVGLVSRDRQNRELAKSFEDMVRSARHGE